MIKAEDIIAKFQQALDDKFSHDLNLFESYRPINEAPARTGGQGLLPLSSSRYSLSQKPKDRRS